MKIYKVDKFTATTTVGDLVSALLKYDQNAYIFTEGCDCIGNVVGISVMSNGLCIDRDDCILEDDGTINDKYKDRIGK